MFRAYVNILAIILGLSNFAVLASALGSGRDVTAQDLLVPAAVLFLLVSLVFVMRRLMILRDTRIVRRALAQHRAQVVHFKTALGNQSLDGSEFSRGMKSWNY